MHPAARSLHLALIVYLSEPHKALELEAITRASFTPTYLALCKRRTTTRVILQPSPSYIYGCSNARPAGLSSVVLPFIMDEHIALLHPSQLLSLLDTGASRFRCTSALDLRS